MISMPVACAGPVARRDWVRQPDAVLTQANPVSGTPYEVLAATDRVRIHSVTAQVKWTVQPTPLEVWLIIDGIQHNHGAVGPITTKPYGLTRTIERAFATAIDQHLISAYTAAAHPLEYEGRSVQVLAEITGGTVQELACRVKWSRKV